MYESFIGKKCVIRSWGAGVFVGQVIAAEPAGNGRVRVLLRGSARLWSWRANSGVSISGIAASGFDAAQSTVDKWDGDHLIDDVIEIVGGVSW